MYQIETKTLYNLLEYMKETHGELIAIVENGKTTNYIQLEEEVMKLALAYEQKGLSRKKIDLIPELSADWIKVYLALMISGAIVVLHEPGLPIEEYIRDIYMTADAHKLAAYIPSDGKLENKAGEENTATIVYTSGTSGRKKGVMLSQKNLVSDVILACYKIGKNAVRQKDRTIPILPLFHMFGITASILSPLFIGMELHIIQEMKYIIKAVAEVKPRILFVVPMIAKTMMNRAVIMQKKGIPAEVLKSQMFGGLEIMVSGGAALQQELIEDYEKLGIQLLNGYGITECSPVVTTSSYHDFKKGAVGKITDLPGAQVRLINHMVHVSGDIVMQGYYGIEESPFQEIDGRIWYNTRDYGEIDEQGNLFIKGRESNMIILEDGNNIAPEELERMFEEYGLIKAVMVYESEMAGSQVIAMSVYPDYELAGNKSEEELRDDIEEIVDMVNQKLPMYKKIKKVYIRKNDFERTSLRKIIRTGVNKDAGDH